MPLLCLAKAVLLLPLPWPLESAPLSELSPADQPGGMPCLFISGIMATMPEPGVLASPP